MAATGRLDRILATVPCELLDFRHFTGFRCGNELLIQCHAVCLERQGDVRDAFDCRAMEADLNGNWVGYMVLAQDLGLEREFSKHHGPSSAKAAEAYPPQSVDGCEDDHRRRLKWSSIDTRFVTVRKKGI